MSGTIRGWALAGLLSLSGCSYLFVTPPHEASDGRVIGECTTNRVAPAVDTLLVTTNALGALYAATADGVQNRGIAIGVGVGAAAFWLSSAIYGYYNTGRCSELLDDETPYSRPAPHSGYVPPRPRWQPMPPPVLPPAGD